MDQFKDVQKQVVGDVELAFVEQGEGPPLILIHGSASDLRTWQNQLAAFSDSFRTIAYSRRYARPNQEIDDGVDDQTLPHVNDLIGFIEKLGLEKVNLMGHSWGAFIALMAAMKRPDLIGRLVLEEPPIISLFVDIPPKPSQILKLLVTKPGLAGSIIKFAARTVGPAQKLYKKGDDEAAMKVFGRGIFGPEAFEAIGQERMNQVRENLKADKAQVTGAGFPSLDKGEVGAVEVPTLLLHGSNSPPLFRRMIRELETIMPDARLFEVDSASHLVHEDNPSFVNQTVRDFLAG